MARITCGARACHAGLVALAIVALAGHGHAEPLADLLGGVATNARFATPARADVDIECGEGCAGAGRHAIFLGKEDALYVEVKDGQRALLRPGHVVVLEGGKPVEAAPGTAFAGTDVLLEDLVPFVPASLRMPQVSDDGPAGVVVTAAPGGTSAYSLLVHTIDRDRRVIVRTLYYHGTVNDLAKTRRDSAHVRVAGGWRPGEIVVETLRQATHTRLRLAWHDAPDAPAALFDPGRLAQPSGLAWP